MSDLEFLPRRKRGAIADVWRATLSQIPTEFGKLAYFAALRNANTGIYEHHGLTAMFGEEESRAALTSSHADTFAVWLALPLEQQKADLDAYLAELGEHRAGVVSNWLSSRSYQNFAPALARDAAKALFMSDMAALLGILKHECGVVYPDPDA
jgi:hypothetical protein